ncbi:MULTISPECIES: DUF883 family protein [unclassified Sphingomonas]|uniref:DUF883 family protein n=1 Tax=unclassified Sphingomonas TaxID=196159 RepID=UPI0006F831F2|nr:MULTISPECIES: DUF883 family protein [unclassified Sphingomonas]KQM98096.1 hypothetical protein ASE78_07480 [Sphingomonas sp. Leaf25]KQN37715.1 hypothetical protein ASE97_09190 [Sphingomonas sp. Leaf42]KQT28082.1 hypothetical protein ASG37_11900 [Sphingomonas sp. Leaf407]
MTDHSTQSTIDTLKEKAATTADTVKDKASHAAHVTSDAAHDAAQRASDGIDANPLAVLAGGLALGALAGALIPKSAQEAKVLGPLGKRLSAAATAAAATARDVGKEQLAAALPSKDGAKEQLRSAFGTVVQAATDSGKAAVKG